MLTPLEKASAIEIVVKPRLYPDICRRLLREVFFYSGSASGWEPGVLLVSDNYLRVWVNPHEWKKLSSDERIHAAAHEMGHILYGS